MRQLFALVCGLSLIVLAALGFVCTRSNFESVGMLVDEHISVAGAQYSGCQLYKQLDEEHCTDCGGGLYYNQADPNGTSTNICYHVCASGGMNCDPMNPCDGCEVYIPCNQEFCNAPGECPE